MWVQEEPLLQGGCHQRSSTGWQPNEATGESPSRVPRELDAGWQTWLHPRGSLAAEVCRLSGPAGFGYMVRCSETAPVPSYTGQLPAHPLSQLSRTSPVPATDNGCILPQPLLYNLFIPSGELHGSSSAKLLVSNTDKILIAYKLLVCPQVEAHLADQGFQLQELCSLSLDLMNRFGAA